MRLTKKLKQQYIDRAKEEIFKLTGIHASSCMVVGNGPGIKVSSTMMQRMGIFGNGADQYISCCVEGDRYFTGFYCDKLPYWMSNPCTDGQKDYPDAAIPKDRYDNLKAIAEGRTRIKAVDEWNALVKEYKRNKSTATHFYKHSKSKQQHA